MTGIVLSLAVLLAASSSPSPASSPASEDAFAENACVRCHQRLPGGLGEIATHQWKASVHYANRVACDGCHGGDATAREEQFPNAEAWKLASHMARDPKFLVAPSRSDTFVDRVRGREVSYFCGKCHSLIKEKHLGSPHGNNGDPTCLYCHARAADGHFTHEIRPASLDIIDTRGREEGGRCSPCHQAPTMQAVRQIKTTLAQTSELIEEASKEQEDLVHRGYRSLELAGLQEHGEEVNSRLRRVFHSFDMREINGFAGEVKALAERTSRTHDLLEQVSHMRRRQTVVALAICAFLLAFVGLLLHYKHAYCLEHAEQPKS